MTPKVLVSFVSIVLVLAIPSLIMVTCPTCHGAGHVSTMPGVENLRIVDLESKVVYYWENPCGGGVIRSAFDVTVANDGSELVHGIMEITGIDPNTGLNLTKRLMYLEIPANISGYILSGTIAYGVLPGAQAYFPHDMKLSARIPLGEEVTCPSCSGKGTVSILRWPIIYMFGGLKPIGPPPEAPWEIPVEAI
jgi:hypothetical protein